MTEEKPLISFVMPTRNRIEWIGESLQSLLTQKEQNIEIIVVNDASYDGTTEWLKKYENNELIPLLPYDKRVKIIHNETRQGGGKSRNIGADVAKADIIGVCDDDDINADERATLILKHFDMNPKSEMVNFGYMSVGYFNEKVEEFPGEPFDHELFLKEGKVNYYCNPACAYKKESAKEIGGYGEETVTLTDDYQFVDKWVKAGKKIDFQPGFLVVFHRVLPRSMMAGIRSWRAEWVKGKK